jgi:hypothetical protein
MRQSVTDSSYVQSLYAKADRLMMVMTVVMGLLSLGLPLERRPGPLSC